MGDIDVDPQLIGSLAEVYYKEYSDQKGGWAYTSLENIHNKFENDILEFKIGFHRPKIKIPSEIVPEIKKMSEPRYLDESNPSFVFDFLACKIYDDEDVSSLITSKTVDNFRWIEVKSEGGKISKNQLNAIQDAKLQFTLCVVYNIHEAPYDVYLKFFYDEIPDWMLKY
jgi:hypothetical protein